MTSDHPSTGTLAAESGSAGPSITPRQRALATVFLMGSAVMNMVDTTIANVALPQMQGTTAASREEITWVLTSFVIAMAIVSPLVGWMTARWSRKTVLVTAVSLFTFFSMLCGIATTVDELVLFRIFQGMSGAPLIPLVQTTLLDIYPREEHGKAMAIFGIAGIAGPLLGPLLGGWLTSNFSWGWVFLVNLPIGAISAVGLAATMPGAPPRPAASLDLTSYGLFALSIGSLQLMLDRGAILDWFDSTEIRIEALVSALSFAGFVGLSMIRPKPFITPAIVKNRTYVTATFIAMVAVAVMMATMALLPELLSQYYGYSPQQIGYLTAPRGAATLMVTPFIPALLRRFGSLRMMMAGIVIMSLSSLQLGTVSPDADGTVVAVSGIIQGLGNSLFWTPLSLVVYSTIDPSLRDEAASLHILLRTLSTGLGISVLQSVTLHDAVIAHAGLAGAVQLQNLPPVLHDMAAAGGTAQMAAAVNAEVTRQAGMIAHIDSFRMMFIAQLATLPLVLLLRPPRARRPHDGRARTAELAGQ